MSKYAKHSVFWTWLAKIRLVSAKGLLSVVCLLWLVSLKVAGQAITQHEADSLEHSLAATENNSVRMEALLRLAEFHLAQDGSAKADLDAAIDEITQAEKLNTKVELATVPPRIALLQSQLYRKRGEKERGRRLAETTLSQLSSSKDFALLGELYLNLSQFSEGKDSTSRHSRLDLLQKALVNYERTGNLERQGYCLEKLAEAYKNIGNREKAIEQAQLAIERYKSVHYLNLEGPYILLSRIYELNEDYTRCVSYGLLALRAAIAVGDSSMQLCKINYTIGGTYYDLSDFANASRYLRQALQIAIRHLDTSQIYIVAFSIVAVDYNLRAPGDGIALLDSLEASYPIPNDRDLRGQVSARRMNCYTAMKKFNKAQVFCDSLLKTLSYPLVYNFDAYYVYVQVMDFYLASGQKNRARDSMAVFLRTVQGYGAKDGKQMAFWMSFRLDTAEHVYRNAVLDLQNYYGIKDSLFTEEKTRQIEQLQVAYETSEKEKDIALLQKKGALQMRDLIETKRVRNIFIAGVGLTLLFLTVLYNRYRLKQRKNRELVRQQKEIAEKNIELELNREQILDKNAQLERILHENETLLREVHHRVKNNLQIVMSLLTSQAAFLQDEKALNAVQDSRHRVQSMALIHQRLYRSSDVSVVLMSEYVTDLVYYLRDSFTEGRRILFHLQIDPITLDVSQAIPVGLILNELVTNAFKYAFPNSDNDTIGIALKKAPDGRIELAISDNGKGLPPDFDIKSSKSYGVLLVQGLVNDLNGDLELQTATGTAYLIRFKRAETTNLMNA